LPSATPISDLTAASTAIPTSSAWRSLDDVLSQVGESFAEALLRLIDEHGMTDDEVEVIGLR
jgi:hypothetical protein